MALTQVERIRAAHGVDGYYNPKPNEFRDNGGTERAFRRAKAEYVEKLQNALAIAELLTYEEFIAGRRGQ